MVDDCFAEMLSHWLSRPSPPPTKEELIAALKSPTIGHEDIAKRVQLGSDATKCEWTTGSLVVC